MDELEARLAQLKRRADSAISERARAIAVQDSAKIRVASAVKELKQRFGVSSISEAQGLCEKMTAEANEKLREAEKLLEAVEDA